MASQHYELDVLRESASLLATFVAPEHRAYPSKITLEHKHHCSSQLAAYLDTLVTKKYSRWTNYGKQARKKMARRDWLEHEVRVRGRAS